MKWLFILGLILLVACAQTEKNIEPAKDTPIPTDEEQGPVIEPELVGEETVAEQTVEQGEEQAPLDEWSIPEESISHVVCEKKDARVSFTITNTDDKLWEIGTILSFPPPQDRMSVNIFVNGLNVIKEKDYFTDEKFADCFDEIELAPGESFSCSLSPAPIVTPNEYTRNYVQVQGGTVNDQVTFVCE